jgi:hypothetical protein
MDELKNKQRMPSQTLAFLIYEEENTQSVSHCNDATQQKDFASDQPPA